MYSSRFKKLEGFEQMLKSYKQEVYKLKSNTLKGMIKAQAMIRESMDATRPLIPVDTGNMRKSWFCVTSNSAVISGKNPAFSNDNYDASKLSMEHAAIIEKAMTEATAKGKAYGPFIVFGLSAYYASYVEHMYSRKGHKITWTREGSGPEFFIKAIKRTKSKILRILAQSAKIKP